MGKTYVMYGTSPASLKINVNKALLLLSYPFLGIQL